MKKDSDCKYYKSSSFGMSTCNNFNNTYTHCEGVNCGYFTPKPKKVPSKEALGDSLLETHKIITGERLNSYGKPEDCFQLIAEYWNVYLKQIQADLLKDCGHDLEDYTLTSMLKAKDVAHLMILFKMARIAGPETKRDNYIDIQGYAAIAADTLTQEG